jgi:transposase
MIGQLPPGTRVHLSCKPIDLRKGFDGLSAYVADAPQDDPYGGAIFVFRSKRADYVKILLLGRIGHVPVRQTSGERRLRQAADCATRFR